MKTQPVKQNQPERFYRVSCGQFSIVRHYGKIKYNGATYVWEPEKDSIVREDVLEREKKAMSEQKRAELRASEAAREKAKWTEVQMSLFGDEESK